MLEDVIQNRQHILICIQYEVLQKKEVFEAYKSFCKILGEDVMKYHEFDFWFYYFLNGNFNLDYERKMEKKPAELADMPIEVAYKIVQKSNWKEKFIFRDVSKKCREAVDETPTIIDKIYLRDSDWATFVTFDDQTFKYGKHEDDLVESDEEESEYDEEDDEENDFDKEIEEKLEAEESEKRVVQKLAIVLNNPRLQIGELVFIIMHKTLVDKLNALFQSLNHQLHVKSFEYSDNQGAYWKFPEEISSMKLLTQLKPGVLETIGVYSSTLTNKDFNSNLEGLTKMEQWKRAKKFYTNTSISENINKVAHFDVLHAHIDSNFKPEDVVALKNIYMNSPTFEHCKLLADGLDKERIRDELGGDRFSMADGSTLYANYTGYSVTFTRR